MAMAAGDTEDGLGKCGLDPDRPSEAQATEMAGEGGSSVWSGSKGGRRTPFVVPERTEPADSSLLGEARGAVDSNTWDTERTS